MAKLADFLKKPAVGMILVAGFAISFLAVITLRAPVDQFKFLKFRPTWGGILLDASYAGHGSFGLDYRIYTWKAEYQEVVAQAKEELTPLRYLGQRESATRFTFQQGNDWVVTITPGRSHTRKDGLDGPKTVDDGWVTVVVGNRAEPTLKNRIRGMFEPRG